MSDRVTIKSIARDLGISHMTVSRALSGSPNVRKDTRVAVIAHAAQLGYVKSAAANAIRGRHTGIVGLLLPNLTNEFYAHFADCLAQYCDRQERQLIIHLTNDEIERERQAVFKLREVQAETVIMVPTPVSLPADEDYLGDMQVIQLIRTRPEKKDVAIASVDDGVAFADAVRHLAQGGHTRIGFIGGSKKLSSGSKRLEAFLNGLQASGLAPDSELILTGNPSYAMGYAHVLGLVEQRATAVICGGFEISNGALNGLLKNGLELPADISFIGYGDPSYYQWIQSGISTIRVPVEHLAVATAELINSVDSKSTSGKTEQRCLRADLILRSS